MIQYLLEALPVSLAVAFAVLAQPSMRKKTPPSQDRPNWCSSCISSTSHRKKLVAGRV